MKKLEKLQEKYKNEMHGETKYFMYKLCAKGIDKRNLFVEFREKNMNYMVDLAILPNGPRKNDVWPYKGIFIEFDGPSHYYAPCGPKGEHRPSTFTQHRMRMLEGLGYKVYVQPFYWETKYENIEIFEENSGFELQSYSQDKMIQEIYDEYVKMKKSF